MRGTDFPSRRSSIDAGEPSIRQDDFAVDHHEIDWFAARINELIDQVIEGREGDAVEAESD